MTLSAPYHERQRLFGLAEGVEGGIQGKLLLSLTLLAPGDKPKVHAEGEVAADGVRPEVVLLPPSFQRRLVFLTIKVFCARGLPRMDSVGTAGIDAYVKIRFNG